MEAKLRQHSEAIDWLVHSSSSSQNTDTQGITSLIRAYFNMYDELDDDNRKALLSSAISINDIQLQCALLDLRVTKGNTGTTLAKLTKELIKLAETYKVPELRFEEHVT